MTDTTLSELNSYLNDSRFFSSNDGEHFIGDNTYRLQHGRALEELMCELIEKYSNLLRDNETLEDEIFGKQNELDTLKDERGRTQNVFVERIETLEDENQRLSSIMEKIQELTLS